MENEILRGRKAEEVYLEIKKSQQVGNYSAHVGEKGVFSVSVIDTVIYIAFDNTDGRGEISEFVTLQAAEDWLRNH